MNSASLKRAKVLRILRRLERAHGPQQWTRRGSCLDVLVRAMLSQNTNVINARRGYRQLRRRFPTWTQVMNADVREVQRHIAVCGLARMRAWRLVRMLRTIKSECGALDLEFLADRSEDEAWEYLARFYGIGPKTIACTLLFGLNVPVFPVENGIVRMSRRLRIVRAKAREEEVRVTVERLTPPGRRYALHVLMFRHARELCRPKNPRCDECVLVELCPYGTRRLRHQPPPRDGLAARGRPVTLSRYASDGLAKDGTRPNDLWRVIRPQVASGEK